MPRRWAAATAWPDAARTRRPDASPVPAPRARPARAPRARSARRAPTDPAPTAPARTRARSCRALSRVDQRVGDVDQQVHEDEDRAGPDREAHDRVVVGAE